jgi:hypothetical protein
MTAPYEEDMLHHSSWPGQSQRRFGQEDRLCASNAWTALAVCTRQSYTEALKQYPSAKQCRVGYQTRPPFQHLTTPNANHARIPNTTNQHEQKPSEQLPM